MNIIKYVVMGLVCFAQAGETEDKLAALEKRVTATEAALQERKDMFQRGRQFRMRRCKDRRGPHGSCHGRGPRGEGWKSRDIASAGIQTDSEAEDSASEVVILEAVVVEEPKATESAAVPVSSEAKKA